MHFRHRRSQPYDFDNPANWTVKTLNNQLEALGVKLTSTMPKSSLIELYQQHCKQTNGSGTVVDTINHQTDFQSAAVNQTMTQTTGSMEVSTDTQTPNSNCNGTESSLPGTLGVITAMQSTISSLQTTISNLLTEKSSVKTNTVTSSTNLLERYYGTQIVENTPNQPTDSQFGVSANDLPHVDVVFESLRRKIIEGKYINLACLLIPEFEAPNVTTNEISGIEFLRQGRKDHRLDRVLTITQFYKAFGIHKRITCEVYPQLKLELDLYEADIGNISDHYGEMFYQYHCQFTRKAAAY